MITTTTPDRMELEGSIYSACTKKALVRLAREIGIKEASTLRRTHLIDKLEAQKPRAVLESGDLLSNAKPFLNAINKEIAQVSTVNSEQNLIKDKILEIFGSSLSRLPYLTAKTVPDSKDWISIQTISMNLELFHDLLGTKPICKPGAALKYDPNIHEGPSAMKAGQDCIAVSTGISRGSHVFMKALVTMPNNS